MDLNAKEIWFVTGSQHLYGDEALGQVAENSRRIVAGLNDAKRLPLRLVFKPVVTTPGSILQVCREANAAPDCAGLVCWMHTFSPAKMWIAGLKALDKPLAHLHTQFNRDLPWSTIDMDFMNLNQAAHGDREFGFICTRMQVPRKVVVGHWQDPEVQDRLAVWMRSAAAQGELKSLKVARFGDNMRQVAVTEGDKVEAQMRLGIEVNGYGVGDLVARVRDVAETARGRPGEAVRRPVFPGRRRSRPAATAANRCGPRPGSSWGCATSSTAAASRRSPTRSRICPASNSCRAWPCKGSWPTATASAPRATGRQPP